MWSNVIPPALALFPAISTAQFSLNESIISWMSSILIIKAVCVVLKMLSVYICNVGIKCIKGLILKLYPENVCVLSSE